MCGIFGAFGRLEKNNARYNEMLATMRHRGPDESGLIKKDAFCLGHQRLSIIDVEKGKQPLQDRNGEINLVCNGELYNHQNLRREVCGAYDFSTNSDSEVIIAMYKQQGVELVKHLDGMFGFVLADNDRYFIARDPIGIKPLYFGFDNSHVYISSEIKALINYADQIKEFPNGHYFHPTEGLQPYYSLPTIKTFITDKDLAVAKIRETLTKSVRKRLMSEVPIGAFLSGGLDSSIIASLMKDSMPELHSFSVGLEGSPDLKAARLVAEHIGTIHHEYVYSEREMLDALSDVIYYLESFDAALVRSAIPCYFVSRLASRYVKSILTGEGADELFAGYSYFDDFQNPEELQSESLRIINGLHNLNLQRVDRMTMAHSLEARVPFLDIEFIEAALSISPNLRMQNTFGIEKWLLRKAFEDKLPAEIVWRKKMEFAQGCGSSTVLEKKAACITDHEFLVAREQGKPVASKEELLYYNIFRNHFDHPDSSNLIGKWKGKLH